MAPAVQLRHEVAHIHGPTDIRFGCPACPAFDSGPHAFRTFLNEPAFDLHDPMDCLYIDALFPSTVQGPMNSSDASLGFLIDDYPNLTHKALIELVAASFLGFAV